MKMGMTSFSHSFKSWLSCLCRYSGLEATTGVKTYLFGLSPLQVEMGHHLRFIFLVCLGLTVGWTHQINVTVDHSILLPCQVKFSTRPINLKNLYVYWQDNNEKVLFHYDEGKVLSENQNNLYKNRITASENNLAFGNISIKMERLTIQDNSKTVCAYYKEKIGEQNLVKCVCKSTIFVSVPFLKPELSVNNTAMLASCTTRGGFPQPELTWNHTFQNTSNNRIMKRSEAGNTIRTVEQNGTYLVESAVTVTGSLSVTCRVTNPTSKQIVSNTINFSYMISPCTNTGHDGRAAGGVNGVDGGGGQPVENLNLMEITPLRRRGNGDIPD
ncbi:CD276 antigen homolog isoform X2 [Hypomesus transpacificus]|uniref:CD276 antigen homolog isoform X2 n=1 Tax=Hypomesus transpacificus TaxID=137520 RepID=UPI001F07B885|nr:CD276 antigen homolog isoform X2 [Hypomesus transpacificus]